MRTKIDKKLKIKIEKIFSDRFQINVPDRHAKYKWAKDHLNELGFLFWKDGTVSISNESGTIYVIDKKVWKRLIQLSKTKKYQSD